MGETEKMVFYGKLNFKYNLLTPRGTLMLGSHICDFASATCCYAENLKKKIEIYYALAAIINVPTLT